MIIKINNILKEQEKSIYWLANEINITYSNCHKLINNSTTSIKFDIIEKICITLNCTPNDIFEIENVNE